MSVKDKIITFIEDNKVSTTEVADALGKKGVLDGVLPINPRLHKVGEVEFVYACNESNWEVHEQLQTIAPHKIVYVHGIDCGDKAIFGDLVSKYILLYKRSIAIVLSGKVRDAHTLIKENYPIWSSGVTPIGCNNTKNETLPDLKLIDSLREKYHGGVMVCDDCGVVLIEKKELTEELLRKLEFIEYQEDVWFFCMDSHKMSTYEIVCQKKYLMEQFLDQSQLEKLSEFSTE
jgi:4-hydroxy-4-methyl-2-oxoglutarate aldolase